MQLQIQKLHKDAEIPTFAHDTDAGLDLFSVEKVTIASGQRLQVHTGLSFAIPVGFVGLIWDKSGLSHKNGLKTLGGVVDSGYRGEVIIGLLNTSDTEHTFEVGDKIAQMLVQKVERPDIVVVDSMELTDRDEKGFGSTGK